MRLVSLEASRYRSLRHVQMSFDALDVLIGTNASGKSNLLDALRFLSEGIRARDFMEAVADRGGMNHLAWKGEMADEIILKTTYKDEGERYEWSVGVKRSGSIAFEVWERLHQLHNDRPPDQLLEANGGKVWWSSTQAKNNKVNLTLAPTACTLAAACADESFPARKVAGFIQRWGFFDPSPPLLRRPSQLVGAERLDPFGSNLAARLYVLQSAEGGKAVSKILSATRRVLGVPDDIQLRVSDIDGRVYFIQREPGLAHNVHQIGASSGTLRMLALMTALFGEADTSLVGIEEPENHIHPSALKAFAEYLRAASETVQVVVTTHSPLLLDCLPTPGEVAVVQRSPEGTTITREEAPDAVAKALEASGFGLGELYESKGFGA